MAFGSGALISAVAYELVAQAFVVSESHATLAAGLFAGAVVYWIGDLLLDRMSSGSRAEDASDSSGAAILLGVVLDGIPESLVIGLTLVSGQVSAAMVVGVFLSNFPEALGSTDGMRSAGTSATKIWTIWVIVVVASGVAAAVGFVALDAASPAVVAFVLAFAAGAILTMLADTMMPQAFANGGKATGLVTVAGFALAFGVSALEHRG